MKKLKVLRYITCVLIALAGIQTSKAQVLVLGASSDQPLPVLSIKAPPLAEKNSQPNIRFDIYNIEKFHLIPGHEGRGAGWFQWDNDDNVHFGKLTMLLDVPVITRDTARFDLEPGSIEQFSLEARQPIHMSKWELFQRLTQFVPRDNYLMRGGQYDRQSALRVGICRDF